MDKILKFLGIKRKVKTNSLDLSQFELPQTRVDCMFKFLPANITELNGDIIIKVTSNLPYIKKGIYVSTYRNYMVIVRQDSVKNSLNFHYMPVSMYKLNKNNDEITPLHSMNLMDIDEGELKFHDELKFY